MNRLQKGLIGAAFLLAAGNAQAVLSLGDLIGGASFDAGTLRFDDWVLIGAGISTTLPTTPNLANISVDVGSVSATNVEIVFSAGTELTFTSATGGDSIDLFFGFSVTSLDGQPIKDNTLDLTGYQVGGPGDSLVYIGEWVYSTALRETIDQLAFKDVYFDELKAPPDKLTDYQVFPGHKQIWVTKNLYLFADVQDDTVGITEFRQGFSVPEPSVLSLLALGAIGVLWRRRS